MRPWRVILIVVVAITGAAATVTTWQQAHDEAAAREEALTGEIAVLVGGAADGAISALAGGGGLVSATGTVDLEAFEAFAREIIRLSAIEMLAYVDVVLDSERPAFEAALGRPIGDADATDLEPAPRRDRYYAVRAIMPLTHAFEAVLGYDVLADPVRGSAAVRARDTGRTVLTEPVIAQGTGNLSLFLSKPLYRTGVPLDTPAQRRSAHVGFLSTVVAGEALAAPIVRALPEGSRFAVHDGGVELAASSSPPAGGATRTIAVQSREWQLVVEDGRDPDLATAGTLGVSTLLLVGGLLLFVRRAEAHDAALVRSRTVMARTADVAQALAGAQTVGEVEDVVHTMVASVLDAAATGLAIVDRDSRVVRTAPSPSVDPEISGRYTEVPLSVRTPVTEVVESGEVLLLRTEEELAAHTDPAVMADIRLAGLESVACLPLEDRHGTVAAALSLAWSHPLDDDPLTRDTIRTLAELCEYTLDRARTTDQAGVQASQLAELAGRLAVAVTTADVLETITASASSPVGATATSVGLVDREAGVLRTHHGPSVGDPVRAQFSDPPLDAHLAFTEAARTGSLVLLEDNAAFVARYPDSATTTSALGIGARAALPIRDSDGEVVGSMVFAWPGPRVFHDAFVSTLLTIAELSGQALERAGLTEAEHRLVSTLQDSVLVPLPDSPHLDVAAWYLPAAHQVGMGGDWYEGIALDDHRYALIVGDVAGHGITAVGDMAQLRVVVGALVRLGTPLTEVFSRSTELLHTAAHHPTASALLAVVDTEAGQVTYATAGTPRPWCGSRAATRCSSTRVGSRSSASPSPMAPPPRSTSHRDQP